MVPVLAVGGVPGGFSHGFGHDAHYPSDVGFFGLGEVAVALQDEYISVPTDDAVKDDAFRQVACQSHSINRSTSCRTLKITA